MRKTPAPTPRAPRPAFTLIELLVVIVIIGILISVAVTVAGRVTGGGRSRLTEDVIRILDQTRTAAAAALEGATPSKFVDGMGNEFPIIDGRADADNNTSGYQPATIGLYFLSISKVQGLDEMFKGIDPKLVQHVPSLRADPLDPPATPFGLPPNGAPQDANGNDLPTLLVLDAFTDRSTTTSNARQPRKQPIRFVHPTYDNGYGQFFASGAGAVAARGTRTVHFRRGGADQMIEMRRSFSPYAPGGVGDTDEGICTGRLPYFYSIGPDGDPGARADNLYTTKPTFPLETAKFNN